MLDEPCSNLDFESIKIIEKYLLSLKKEKKIIMVTHDMFQAMRLADEIIIINNGELIEMSEKNRTNFIEVMSEMGLPKPAIERLFGVEPDTGITIKVNEVFVQTPGPEAGKRIDT